MINREKKAQVLFLYLLLSTLSTYKVFGFELHNDSYIYFLGVKYTLKQNGNSSNRYILLHGDEKTAKMVLESHIKEYKGIAFFIENEKREIPFKSTIIDPNRIFSRNGSYHALRKFQPGWPPGELKKALDKIDTEREVFLNILMPPNNGILIALHNNFRGYNVEDELNDSELYSIKKDENPRDFILCTNANDYQKLKDGPYNVVLQNRMKKNNNGSLSWAAIERGIRYINIETRLGWLSQQRKMLQFVEKRLKK